MKEKEVAEENQEEEEGISKLCDIYTSSQIDKVQYENLELPQPAFRTGSTVQVWVGLDQ